MIDLYLYMSFCASSEPLSLLLLTVRHMPIKILQRIAFLFDNMYTIVFQGMDNTTEFSFIIASDTKINLFYMRKLSHQYFKNKQIIHIKTIFNI